MTNKTGISLPVVTERPTCFVCGKPIPPSPFPITSGYGLDKDNNKVCYECCAEGDKQFMRDHGKIILYLTTRQPNDIQPGAWRVRCGTVGNWPGSLKFENLNVHKGYHNIARYRYDTWFVFESTIWHGVRYGDNTEICHCKRTKQTV